MDTHSVCKICKVLLLYVSSAPLRVSVGVSTSPPSLSPSLVLSRVSHLLPDNVLLRPCLGSCHLCTYGAVRPVLCNQYMYDSAEMEAIPSL